MEDDDKMKGEASDNDWKVVSLTESAYASEPGPVFPAKTDGNGDNDLITQEPEFSQSLFMSGHFIFPPNEHENLPLNSYEVQLESEAEEKLVYPLVDEVGSEKTQQQIWGLKGFSESSDQHNVEDQGVHLLEDKQEIYNEPVGFDDKVEVELDDLSLPHNMEFSSKDLESPKKDKCNRFPSEAWWKKHAGSLYAQAKESNTFWSIFVAAALMGIVIIGHRWQQERWKIHHFKLKLGNGDMKMHRVVGPLNRFKDVFIGASRRGFGGITSGEN
ncbi:hypothetical protein ZOSMA_41G00890 [Zostera marina]|uniref:ATG8-interacting protein 1 n=1 Tax=Zostera marina TaxID=29655 RepID=A0A0K9P4Y8_ZOSMR|nr:hypothetical protein ZOSMA_41G00890 [Zostera marina]